MPDYKIRDPNTGDTVTLRGDSPPTEQELEEIFAVRAERGPQAPPEGTPRQRVASRTQKAADERLMRQLGSPYILPPSTVEGDPGYLNMLQKDPLTYAAHTVGNVIPSLGRNVVGAAKAIPGIVRMGAGVVTGQPDFAGMAQMGQDIVEGYKERYGGAENIARSLATDPVGVGLDVGTVITGGRMAGPMLTRGASAARGAAPVLADTARGATKGALRGSVTGGTIGAFLGAPEVGGALGGAVGGLGGAVGTLLDARAVRLANEAAAAQRLEGWIQAAKAKGNPEFWAPEGPIYRPPPEATGPRLRPQEPPGAPPGFPPPEGPIGAPGAAGAVPEAIPAPPPQPPPPMQPVVAPPAGVSPPPPISIPDSPAPPGASLSMRPSSSLPAPPIVPPGPPGAFPRPLPVAPAVVPPALPANIRLDPTGPIPAPGPEFPPIPPRTIPPKPAPPRPGPAGDLAEQELLRQRFADLETQHGALQAEAAKMADVIGYIIDNNVSPAWMEQVNLGEFGHLGFRDLYSTARELAKATGNERLIEVLTRGAQRLRQSEVSLGRPRSPKNKKGS